MKTIEGGSPELFPAKNLRIVRLCQDCGRTEATRRIIYPKTGQVQLLCEKCADKRGKIASSN